MLFLDDASLDDLTIDDGLELGQQGGLLKRECKGALHGICLFWVVVGELNIAYCGCCTKLTLDIDLLQGDQVLLPLRILCIKDEIGNASLLLIQNEIFELFCLLLLLFFFSVSIQLDLSLD